MNQLTDPIIVRALYEASQAGVRIDLIVRGVCVLRPGVKGISENIQVRSVVGRFLEHSRVFCFHNDGDPQVFLSSADWMERNLYKRVEICFPVEDKRLLSRTIEESLTNYLADNANAWILQSDGSYKRVTHGSHKQRGAQQTLLQLYCE
jgi:polyphosphate kinase